MLSLGLPIITNASARLYSALYEEATLNANFTLDLGITHSSMNDSGAFDSFIDRRLALALGFPLFNLQRPRYSLYSTAEQPLKDILYNLPPWM